MHWDRFFDMDWHWFWHMHGNWVIHRNMYRIMHLDQRNGKIQYLWIRPTSTSTALNEFDFRFSIDHYLKYYSRKYLRSSRLDKVSPHEPVLVQVHEPSKRMKAPISHLKLKSIRCAILKIWLIFISFLFFFPKIWVLLAIYLLFNGIWSRDMNIYCKRNENFSWFI